MAKKATAKAASGAGKKVAKKSGSSGSGRSKGGKSRAPSGQHDSVDTLLKLLQSPLVIDLLAVGATAALAAITETRSSRREGSSGDGKKTLKAAGSAAAAAVGRRLANEIDEIRAASQKAKESPKTRPGAKS